MSVRLQSRVLRDVDLYGLDGIRHPNHPIRTAKGLQLQKTPLLGSYAARILLTARLTAFLAALLALTSHAAATVLPGTLSVRVIDHFSGAPLPGINVKVLEEAADGTWSSRASSVTGATGTIDLSILGLGSGARFIVRTKPYADLIERAITTTGTVEIRAGKLKFMVVNGETGAQFANRPVTLLKEMADGSFGSGRELTTDPNGAVHLDPPGLGTDRYVLRAASPADGSWKFSEAIMGPGAVQFKVGNPPVKLELTDWATGAPLGGTEVKVFELLTGSARVPVTERLTGANGRANIDLDGLDAGRRYLVRLKPYNQWLEREVNAPGVLDIRAGQVPVTVVNAVTGAAYGGREVSLMTVNPGGDYSMFESFTSDAAGLVRLDPPDLGVVRYVLRAASPVDSSWRFSALITRPGAVQFVVGNPAVVLRVTDWTSGAALGGVEVRVLEILPDGNRVPVTERLTAADGSLSLDLEGVGAGRRYVVRLKPYDQWIERKLTAAGEVAIRAGKVVVTVLNGETGAPYANQPVSLMVVDAAGTYTQVLNFTTDAGGVLRLDPAALGASQYVLRAASPVDGSLKFSSVITAAGPVQFEAGNPPVNLELEDWTTGAPLSGQSVQVFEALPNGTQVAVTNRVTDTEGRVVLDLDGLAAGRRYVLRLKPYAQWIEREVIAPGLVRIRAGKVVVTVLNGVTGAPYANQPVTLLKELSEGSYEQAEPLTTDQSGVMRLDPRALGVKHYVLRATSPVDGSWKFSEAIMGPGPFVFNAGNPPVTVEVTDWTSGEPLPAQTVEVVEVLPDGVRTPVTERVTGTDGRTQMDLDGLTAGRRYIVRLKPYAQWIEREVVTAGWVGVRVGSVTVRLVDADVGTPFAGVELKAYIKNPNGSLEHSGSALTGENGTARFDPPELLGSAAYVFRVDSPFDDGRIYYSAPVVARGPYEFRVSRDGPEVLDRNPPSFEITAALTNLQVSDRGFVLSGYASDDRSVRSIFVDISNAAGDRETVAATHDPATNLWRATVKPAWLTPGGEVTVTVRVVDEAYNEATATVSPSVIDDRAPPRVLVDSHAEGERVHDRGVVIHGKVLDKTQFVQLYATIENAAGIIADESRIEVDTLTERWTLAVPQGQLTGHSHVSIRLRAVDFAGNESQHLLSLAVDPHANALRHLAARITFGLTPARTDEISALGFAGFLNQQLAPATIDDGLLEARLATEPLTTLGDFRRHLLLRVILSRRQLLELMTWFWENHFNTDFTSHGALQWEVDENSAFRRNALGRFRDLLGVSARSPAMLYYLDGKNNRKRAPNENYARELLELHTLGLGGGYTQRDVEEAARAFTGWTVRNDKFYFNPEAHDATEKRVLGEFIRAGGGKEDGQRVLDIAAAHPATANHVCSELISVFVADEPPASLVARCAERFRAQSGAADQIAGVLHEIFDSGEFRGPGYRRVKVKTPLEYIASIVRLTDALGSGIDLANEIRELGQEPFSYPVPTGYSYDAADWMSGDLMLKRLAFVGRLLESPGNGENLHIDPNLLLDGLWVGTTDGVVGHLMKAILGNSFSGRDLATVRRSLTEDGTRAFDFRAADATLQIQRAVRAALSLPGYQLH